MTIRVTQTGTLAFRDLFLQGWVIDLGGETVLGDPNDPATPAGLVALAAIFIYAAGFAGFDLAREIETPHSLDVERAVADAIKKARS